MQACRVLYLYAGAPRKSSVKAFLARMSKATGVAVYVTEMDIVRSKRHDLSRRHLQQRLLAAIKKQRYNALLASPPCNTFSRARHSAQPGPRPLRDINHPYGVPGLTAREKAAVRQGTVLAKFAIAAVHAQLASSATAMALLEHPEDLGTAARGRPASIWQWPEARALTNEPNAASIAIHQSSFGTAYPKPTRLTGRLPDLHLVGAQGWPTFCPQGRYLGPLAKPQAQTTLRRQPNDAGFRTTGTAAWPSQLCQWVAQQILKGYQAKVCCHWLRMGWGHDSGS